MCSSFYDFCVSYILNSKRLVTNKIYVSSHDLISAHFFRVYKHHVIPTLTPLTPHIGRDLSYLTKLKYSRRASGYDKTIRQSVGQGRKMFQIHL